MSDQPLPPRSPRQSGQSTPAPPRTAPAAARPAPRAPSPSWRPPAAWSGCGSGSPARCRRGSSRSPVSLSRRPRPGPEPVGRARQRLVVGLPCVFPDSPKGFNFQERDRLISLLRASAAMPRRRSCCTCRPGLHPRWGGLPVARPGAAGQPVHLAVAHRGPRRLRQVLRPAQNRRSTSPGRWLIRSAARSSTTFPTACTPRRRSRAAGSALASCGPGEVALPIDDVGASAFAYYVAQGLAGAVARYSPTGADDGRVRLWMGGVSHGLASAAGPQRPACPA